MKLLFFNDYAILRAFEKVPQNYTKHRVSTFLEGGRRMKRMQSVTSD